MQPLEAVPFFYNPRILSKTEPMATVRKTVLVLHSAEQMYELVRDVSAYPQFLPWCGGVDVHESSAESMRATLRIDFKGVRQSFTTANTQIPGRAIDMQLVDGPFTKFQGHWRFVPLQDGEACQIDFALEYHFASRLVEAVIGPVFHHIVNTFVDAFVRRADAVHG